MLEMKQECERCGQPLQDPDADVFICSYECTWCATCVDQELGATCPNCRGPLRLRPPRFVSEVEATERGSGVD